MSNDCRYSYQLSDESWVAGEHIFENGICFNCGAKDATYNKNIEERILEEVKQVEEQSITA